MGQVKLTENSIGYLDDGCEIFGVNYGFVNLGDLGTTAFKGTGELAFITGK